jgi:hypothetical protein
LQSAIESSQSEEFLKYFSQTDSQNVVGGKKVIGRLKLLIQEWCCKSDMCNTRGDQYVVPFSEEVFSAFLEKLQLPRSYLLSIIRRRQIPVRVLPVQGKNNKCYGKCSTSKV